jgi:hypothetical protein
MGLRCNSSYPRRAVAVYLRGGKAAKGGSIRTIIYVSGALVTVVLIAVTAVATIH